MAEHPAGPPAEWLKQELLDFLRSRYGTHSEYTGRRLTSHTPKPDLVFLAEVQQGRDRPASRG